MDNLFKLKGWFSLDDASKYFREVLNTGLTSQDIFQFGVEGKIHLSYLLEGSAELLVRDQTSMYGWSYQGDRVEGAVFKLNIQGMVKDKLSEVVLGITSSDKNLIDDDNIWWSVFRENEEYRLVSIGLEDPNDPYLADKVPNLPLKTKWIVIDSPDFWSFVDDAKAANIQKNPELPEPELSVLSLFTSPPQNDSFVFDFVREMADKYIKANSALPTENQLWRFIADDERWQLDEKNRIRGPLTKPLDKDNFKKNFKNWTR